MSTTSHPTCCNCNRRATHRVANGFSGNGKVVCQSARCWTVATGGYPAEGKSLS